MSLLEAKQLTVEFDARAGVPGHRAARLRAVDQVSFEIKPGETVGLVGESGCGKTTLGRAVLRLVDSAGGRILFDGADITRVRGEPLRALRRKLQMMFQDPYSSLDPRFTVGETVGEALDIHGLAAGRQARAERIASLLEAVGLDPAQAGRHPHEFSGGQRQRVGIARALAVEPKLVVCDEPVSALDVSVQAQIVNLLQDLQRERGLAYLFIAHDLAVVEHISHRILVMYLGRLVETGPARQVCAAPAHPYTQALLSAVPSLEPARGRLRIRLAGDPPSPLDPPAGCPFHPRCPAADEKCRMEAPAWRDVGAGHRVACHYPVTVQRPG